MLSHIDVSNRPQLRWRRWSSAVAIAHGSGRRGLLMRSDEAQEDTTELRWIVVGVVQFIDG